ncbi:MAG: type II toxin-antitoxin system Phd/YefM family antitoxin [Candidatus Latescibacterota bacterium]
MSSRSDNAREQRISATEASRAFSQLLDQVEAGRRLLVHRRGRDVCVMVAPEVQGRSAAQCLALLRGRPPVLLDDRFAEDLMAAIGGERVGERPSWGS